VASEECALLAIVLVWTAPVATAFARQHSAAAICDTSADFFLEAEDYPEAIRLHLQVLRRNPNSALAHYHLGFAQGMMGNRAAEVMEYQCAEALGLRNWDLSKPGIGSARKWQLGRSDGQSAKGSSHR
jgi:hypothetical protein